MPTGNHYLTGATVPPVLPAGVVGGYIPVLSIKAGSSGFYLERLDLGLYRDANDSQAPVPVSMYLASSSTGWPAGSGALTPVIPGTAASESLALPTEDWGPQPAGEIASWIAGPGEQNCIIFDDVHQLFVPSGYVLLFDLNQQGGGHSAGYGSPNFYAFTSAMPGLQVGSCLFMNAWICEPT